MIHYERGRLVLNNKLVKQVLIFIVILIFTIVFCVYARKFIILSIISNNINELKTVNNYYAKVISVENDNLHIVESYITRNETLTNLEVISQDKNSSINTSMYKNETNNICQFISHDTKTVKENLDEREIVKVSLFNYTEDFSDLSFFKRLFYTKNVKNITTTNCNDTSCYLIEFNGGTQLWIEKDTGLTLRAIVSSDTNASRTYEYNYKMNILDKITIPDTSEYSIENT